MQLCRLQTVPDGYTVLGSVASVQRQIGNAVPSALAEVLARTMRRQLLGDAIDLASRLIPAPRLPIPEPEPYCAVPFKYRHLIGDHEAHPGTGQGYAAARRKDRDEEAVETEARLAFG